MFKFSGTVDNAQQDSSTLAFWMANSSELLHFLKSDRHITAFSLRAQDILAETVHNAFKFLVTVEKVAAGLGDWPVLIVGDFNRALGDGKNCSEILKT